MTDRELPMMPWFPKDFSAATAGWSFAEAAVYRCLLDAQWLMGPLPNDPVRLARIAKCDQSVFDEAWPAVKAKFTAVGGQIINARLEEHRAESMRRKEVAANNGSRGGRASAEARSKQRLSNPSSDAQASLVAKSNPPSPSPSPSEELRIGPLAPDLEEAPEEDYDVTFLFNAFLPEAGGRKNAPRLGKIIKQTRGGAEVCATAARTTLEEISRKAAKGETMEDPFAYFAGLMQKHSRQRLVV